MIMKATIIYGRFVTLVHLQRGDNKRVRIVAEGSKAANIAPHAHLLNTAPVVVEAVGLARALS